MSSRIETEQVEEEDVLVQSQGVVERRILGSSAEQGLDLIEDPGVQLRCICCSSATDRGRPALRRETFGEVLEFFSVGLGVNSAFDSSLLEHWQNIRAAPAPSMPTLIENAVKIDRIKLPTRSDRRHILIQAGYQGDMTGPGLCRHSCM